MTKPELPPMPECDGLLDMMRRNCIVVYSPEAMSNYGLACYRAGMLRAAEICERVEEDAHARYKGKLPNQERGTAYNQHDEGRSDGADECATEIRAEADKDEQ